MNTKDIKQNLIDKEEKEAFELAVLREMVCLMADRLAKEGLRKDAYLGFPVKPLEHEVHIEITTARMQAEENIRNRNAK